MRDDDLLIEADGGQFRGKRLTISVGKGGIGEKLREGDDITPVGSWKITGVRYRADRVARPECCFAARAIEPEDIWSDDPRDPSYNHEVNARDHPFSHERLFRKDHLYDLVAFLDFNWPNATPGAGSAIFLHQWRAPGVPTAGCVAFAPETLRLILRSWTPQSRVVIR